MTTTEIHNKRQDWFTTDGVLGARISFITREGQRRSLPVRLGNADTRHCIARWWEGSGLAYLYPSNSDYKLLYISDTAYTHCNAKCFSSVTARNFTVIYFQKVRNCTRKWLYHIGSRAITCYITLGPVRSLVISHWVPCDHLLYHIGPRAITCYHIGSRAITFYITLGPVRSLVISHWVPCDHLLYHIGSLRSLVISHLIPCDHLLYHIGSRAITCYIT